MAKRKKLPPIHPGELLRDELNEIGVSLNELARNLAAAFIATSHGIGLE